MGRPAVVCIALVFLVAACTPPAAEEPTTTEAETGTTATTQAETVEDTVDGASTPGRLVLLDSSGDIVVINPDGSGRQRITDDAGDTAFYTQPIWSPDGSTLAWGQITADGFAVGIHEPGSDDTTTVATSNLPFYMYWSPDGQHLGVLHNGTTGVEFQMVDVGAGTSTSLDEDAPFYFSWSPDGDRVVTHAGEDRVEAIRPSGERRTLEPSASNYLAPQWTAGGVFHVAGDRLVLEDENAVRTPLIAVSGLTMFVANPQGTLVAVQTGNDGSALSVSAEEVQAPEGGVLIVDVASGQTEVVSSAATIGFFWSPDGESLLVLSVSAHQVVPLVWGRDGSAVAYRGYRPPATMLADTFPFFPQYAQSVSFWSPDAEAFAFAGEVAGELGIWVQRLDEEAPTKVSDGVWVAWSATAESG